ncbi:MAG: flagellar basal body-associated FliL family protein [Acetobacteraceae bacterium]|nr:flagellar basal body-associated FliL family protein [Acetobacteraceae bacterium]
MSAAASASAEAASQGGDAEAPAAGGGRKKLLLLAAPVLLGAIGAGLWFSGILPGLIGVGQRAEQQQAAAPVVPGFFELPEILANLNAPGRRPSYMRLKAKLELADARDSEHVRIALPRLQDLFNTYLREVRPEELRGSAGTHRLREELLARAAIAVAPARITDILFVEMLVQ